MKLTIAHMYAARMNIYGDRGNVIALAERARWRGIEVEVVSVGLDERPDFSNVDLVFIGGAQDKEQLAVSHDLQGYSGKALVAAVEEGAVVLAICGGYQLLGHYFNTGAGEYIPGIGVFDAHTVAGTRRFIGDVIVEHQLNGAIQTLVGFENHSGKTYLGSGAQPLGRIVVGYGNNGEDGTEGAVQRNAYGCYLHGSLLPKNPQFTDHLLLIALRRRYGSDVQLPRLSDELEIQAHQAVIERIRRRGQVQSAIHRR